MYGFDIEPMSPDKRAAFIASIEHLRNTPRDRCLVCQADLSSPSAGGEEHHVWPRAYGGTDLPTVMLCAPHHTYGHTLARKVINALNKGQPPPQLSVQTNGNINVLMSIVKLIVVAWANPMELTKRFQVVLDEELVPDFLLLKETFDCNDRSVVDHAIRIAADVVRNR